MEAYGDICLECGAWEKYYESRSKYNKLRNIKGCVDPDNLFKFCMSTPAMPRSDDHGGNNKSGMKSKTAKENRSKSEKGGKSGKSEPL